MAESALARKTVEPESTEDLFARYFKTRTEDLRNELVLRYTPIAKSVAIQMRGISENYAEVEDMVNQGIITLIDCIERFDPEKGVKFESYAFMRIRGAIIDFVRKQDWRPRRVRKTAKDVSAAYDNLSNTLMREPTDTEIADFLEMPEADLHKHYFEHSRAMVMSFEAILENSYQADSIPAPENDMEVPEQHLFRQELMSELAEAVDTLTERERLVISLYYHENLKLAEISKVLGVSESRVSQVHSKAIGKLRDIMSTYMEG